MQDFQTESNSSQETFDLGVKISKKLSIAPHTGHIIALNGDLGSGKTCLTKGIAHGLGVTETVTSPTYTIVNEYLYSGNREQGTTGNREHVAGSRFLYHIDTYRLDGERDFEDIGGVEILSSDNICIIEWSDKIINLLPDDTITINIEITGPETRKITIKGINL